MAGKKRTGAEDNLKNPVPKSGPVRSNVDWVLGTIRTGNSLVSILTGLLAATLIIYSAYVLYDSFSVEQAAYSSAWDLLQYKPEIMDDGDEVMQDQSLAALNKDYRAWLTVYDTTIDYPVVQGPNDLYYASHDVYQSPSLTGAIYLAAANSGSLADSYNVIYGHHMDNKAMFGSLDLFLDEAYFNEHQTGVLVTQNAVYDLTLFAAITTDAYESNIYTVGNRAGEVVDFLTRAKAGEKVETAETKTEVRVWKPDIAASAQQVLAMSTCADATTNGRLVVMAKMTKKKDLKPASGSLNLRGVKVLEGRAFKPDDEWTFTVTAEEGTPMPEHTEVTIRPAESAEIDFGAIQFTVEDLGKTYTYTITESGTVPNVWNDIPKNVTVKVEFDEEAKVMKLTSSTDKTPLIFRNIYTPADATMVLLEGRTELTGRALRPDDVWTLTLTAPAGTPMPPNSSVTVVPFVNPSFSFGGIVYTEADLGKTYTYTIAESGEIPNVINDISKTVTVRIEYDENTHSLKAVCSADQEPTVFINRYASSETTSLKGVKELTGRSFQPGDVWTFTVRGEPAGAPMPDRTRVETDASVSPSFDFGTITFNETNLGQTYSYTITESGSVENVTNDDPKTVTIHVTYDEQSGGLRISNSADRTPVRFVNKYTPKEPVKYYTLTIHYVTEDGEALFPTEQSRYPEGDGYSIVPRNLRGYQPDQERISGTITENTEITFTYRRLFHTLTVEYQYKDGTKAAEPYTETLWTGDEYNVHSPEVEGFVPNRKAVQGTMEGLDLHIIVFYLPEDTEFTFVDEYGTPLGINQHNLQVGLCIE